MGPSIWMLFMFFILVGWNYWLNSPEEMNHPDSEERAKTSLYVVGAIGVISLIIVFYATRSE